MDQSNPNEVVHFTQTHIVNELFDRFPLNKSLSSEEVMALVPKHLVASLPKNLVGLLGAHSSYFIAEGMDGPPEAVRIRRANDTQPLDIARALYTHIPENGISLQVLQEKVDHS